MRIGDRVFVHGYIDEIRKDTVIIRNNGGYFGTIPSEVITGELPSVEKTQLSEEDATFDIPSAEPTWTTEEVAEILANLIGDECACNFNGIDEWLPERCKYAESTCPNPQEKHGCWKEWLLQLAEVRGEEE